MSYLIEDSSFKFPSLIFPSLHSGSVYLGETAQLLDGSPSDNSLPPVLLFYSAFSTTECSLPSTDWVMSLSLASVT